MLYRYFSCSLAVRSEQHIVQGCYLIVIPRPLGTCVIYFPNSEGTGIYIRQIPSGHSISNINLAHVEELRSLDDLPEDIAKQLSQLCLTAKL